MRVITRMLAAWAAWYMARRAPDFVIGGFEAPYMERWWVVPRNKRFNVYLHRISRDDDDRALHDHPWDNASLPLDVGYLEAVPVNPSAPAGQLRVIDRLPGGLARRRGADPHRIILRRDAEGRLVPATSLFFTGRLFREWGFWCQRGWVHHKPFIGERISRGSTTGDGPPVGCPE